MKRVVHGSRLPDNPDRIDELKGKLSFKNIDEGLMKSVAEGDEKPLKDAMLISESINQGISTFNPDLMFESMVDNFSIAKNIYGESILREISGYETDYLERNVKIPEFRKVLKEKIENRVTDLRDNGLLEPDKSPSEKGLELAALAAYMDELENLIGTGIGGELVHKKSFVYGDKDNWRGFRRSDRYRDIALKKSLKLAIRRKHKAIKEEDLAVFERKSRGRCYILYAIDASGSMKGEKIGVCKRAGIALSYKAIDEKDMVGLIVFGSDIRAEIPPTDDFSLLLKEITRIRASRQTDISKTLEKAAEIFPDANATKHLILLSDALPTVGKAPEKQTLEAVSSARNAGITISVVGINLDKKGKRLAEKIVEIGEGKLYLVKDLKEIDKIVLEDYYSVV